MNESNQAQARTSGNPWLFVPALFFLEGIPYFIVSTVSVTMFKRMGISNAEIGLWTSLITWPWTIKMLWGPLIESTSTKRKWIVGTQICAVVTMLLAALTITTSNFLMPTLAILTILAFLSATHDIAADGFYLLALSPEDQAYFVGIRSTAYRLANVFCNGGLIYLAGIFESAPGAVIAEAWRTVVMIAAGIYLFFVVVGYLAMPRPKQDSSGSGSFPFKEAFTEYFTQPKLHIILGFILLYRFGESMVSKMSNPFIIDTIEKGGLGLTTSEVGFITGVVGVVALTVGGIVGGMVVAKYGIKRSLWPMVLAMNVPNLLYIWAATVQPDKSWVTLIVGCDQFGYGFGFTAYMVYLMFITQGSKYPTAHYAISTGLMALGAMAAGIASGFIQSKTGYAGFFTATLVCAAPGIMLLPLLPLEKEDLHIAPVDID